MSQENLSKRPLANISIDVDNLWAYLKIYADIEWEKFPSYLPTFVPTICDLLKKHDLTITFFIIGQDATIEENKPWLKQIADAGHEMANHSFHHEPWMSTLTTENIENELRQSHQAIIDATGKIPVGFRGPGFSYSPALLEAVQRLGYSFDSTLLPSSLGPLARLYSQMKSPKLTAEEKKKRKTIFGSFNNAWMPIKPFSWLLKNGELLEIPISTVPGLRFPFHLSHLMWLYSVSPFLAKNYFKLSINLCNLRGIQPSFLLHPLDFLGKENCPKLSFFPGMDLTQKDKLAFIDFCFQELSKLFEIVPMSTFAQEIKKQNALKKIMA
jgi:peptidoglycan-N-acetylglucosamine deacetylase